jgi:Toprim-like
MFKPKELKKIPSLVDDTPVIEEQTNTVAGTSTTTQSISQEVVEVRTVPKELAPTTTQPVLQNTTQIFEGQKINDLEQTGFQTIELLRVASKNMIDKPKFNTAFLDATPLNLVFQSFNAEELNANTYRFMNFDFSIKENKWFNITERKGNINAISLTKQLLAIQEDLNEYDNQKTLFIASCKKLNALQQEVQNLQNISEQEEQKPVEKADTKIESKVENTVAPAPVHNNTPAKTPYKKIDWKQLTEQLNSIPLDMVMEFIGANPNEDGHRGQWKIYKTGHNVQVNGNMWKNWNSDGGGHGAISLLTEYISIVDNINTRDPESKKTVRMMAIKQLMNEFGSDFDSALLGSGATPNFKVPFAMPHVIDFKINDVRNYLHEKRGIPMWIINKQIDTGNLFAGCPSDWKPNAHTPHLKNPDKLKNEYVWAVFLATNGNAAEMRGIDRYDTYAKILAAGSDKSVGGFLLKAEKDCTERTVAALEAAIDSMSYHAFYPGRVAISCMGVNFGLAVSSALEALDVGYKFQLSFDNDLAGNEAAVGFKDKLIEEVGEDVYKEYVSKGQVKFFDLGIRVLQETVKNNETFYFDVKNNERGMEAVKMFQEQLFNVVPKETVKHLLAKGKLRYINVCPDFNLIQDPKLEARQVVDLLESGKPYYLRSVEDQESEEKKPELRNKRIQFENAVNELSQGKVPLWEKDGRLIYEKQPIAKDWNEFFLHMKTQPEMQEALKKQEEQYIKYSKKPEKIEVKIKKETKKSMS